jgi:hypothetical protein
MVDSPRGQAGRMVWQAGWVGGRANRAALGGEAVNVHAEGGRQGSAGRGVKGVSDPWASSYLLPYGFNGAIWRSPTVCTIVLTPLTLRTLRTPGGRFVSLVGVNHMFHHPADVVGHATLHASPPPPLAISTPPRRRSLGGSISYCKSRSVVNICWAPITGPGAGIARAGTTAATCQS